ncbi:MAG: mandelate racemase/muconate lactonizing enzyme family protein [Methyloligellaceae bacterium]
MTVITRAKLSHLCVPLIEPYRLSYRTFEQFEPFLVELWDDEGRYGFADAQISPGSSAETREGGWAFCERQLTNAIGTTVKEIGTKIGSEGSVSPVAGTALISSLEMLESHPALTTDEEIRLPLLVPVQQSEPANLSTEIESLIGMGFRTLKIKVGKNLEGDIERVRQIQEFNSGRATLRIDANRAYTREQGLKFVSSVNPEAIELFEQPCDSDDWSANADVAQRSAIPIMLDEPICSLEDIERAGTIDGVEFCKLKLKRFGGLSQLTHALQRVRELGMQPVLGDGLGSDIHNWLEACVAKSTIGNAGEFNGFLKMKYGLLQQELAVQQGSMVLPAGFTPRLDPEKIGKSLIREMNFN